MDVFWLKKKAWFSYFFLLYMQEEFFEYVCVYKSQFRLDMKNEFSTERVAKHWNRLSREVVESPSLEEFKSRFNVAFRDVVYWWTWHCWVGFNDLRALFQPK